jgi:hypothetical protein
MSRGRLPVSARNHRPALAALALLLVVAGALGSALIAYRSGNRVDVLVARRDIAVGQQLAAADFQIARVATDADGVVRADAVRNFIGSFATSRIPSGTLVNRKMFRAQGVIPDKAVVVGVVLSQTHRPSQQLVAGDVVRVYVVPKSEAGSDAQRTHGTAVNAVRVVNVSQGSGSQGSGSQGDVSVSLLLSDSAAQQLSVPAALGQLAVGLLPASARPRVDFVTTS